MKVITNKVILDRKDHSLDTFYQKESDEKNFELLCKNVVDVVTHGDIVWLFNENNIILKPQFEFDRILELNFIEKSNKLVITTRDIND